MAKKIYTILKLKDEFSKPMKIAARGTEQFEAQAKYANNTVKKFGNNLNNKFKSAVSGSVKVMGGLAAAMAGFGAKTGFSEAMDLEGYKMQLETATKDTKKAGDIMSYAVDLANKTPFEGGELVQGAAQFEAMGMSAKKWLPLAGDMAAATNKDFTQASEALMDAQNGELERMKEFGIKKADIVAKAGEMFKNEQVVNNAGTIVNQEKFNEALVALMQDKFTGGMEKQANTMKGLWSTVTGVTKSSLAKIVGITEDGTIRQGSLYDMLKSKVKIVGDTLQKWQADGTLDAIGNKVTTVVTTAINGLTDAFKFLKDNMWWLLPVASGLLAGFIAFNVVLSIANTIKAVTTAFNILKVTMAALNITMGLSPMFIIPAVIALAVAAGILLWKNWDTIKKKAEKLFKPIQKFVDKVKEFFGFGDKKKVNLEVETKETKTTKTSTGDKGSGGKTQKKNALGTSYFPGGFTAINERGRQESAILPSGTQIIPAGKTKEGQSKKSVIINLYLTIQGNLIGDEKYADMIGNRVVGKVVKALANS